MFAAAAVLALFFGTLEVVPGWSGAPPFVGTLDSLFRTAIADRSAADGSVGGSDVLRPDGGALPPGADGSGLEDGETTAGTAIPDDELTRLDAIPDASSTDPTAATSTDPTAATSTDGAATSSTGGDGAPVSNPPGAVADEADPLARRSGSGDAPRPTTMSSSASPSRSTIAPLIEESAESSQPGFLSLHTYPWGEVYLDGDYVGNSPIVEMRVSAGPHEIRIERDGYRPHVETVTVRPGQLVRRTGIVLSSGAG